MSGDHYGLQTASGHLTVSAESKEPYAADVLATLHTDAAAVIARYPQKRSALLPLLHLVQSVDGYVTGRGVEFCAEVLDLSTAEVSGVATFYTQYKRHPNGDYTIGVCTNTLCAIMGGDQIWDAVSEHLGIGHDETTEDGVITLERVECNAACDYAPVVMGNWEFFDNQTPESTIALVDDLRAGKPVKPTRGPNSLCTFKQVERVLAGFLDDKADEGVGAGPASLVGLEVAKAHDWVAPAPSATRADDLASGDAVDVPAPVPATGAPVEPVERSTEATAPTEAVSVAAVTSGAPPLPPEVIEESQEEREETTAADDAVETAVEDEGEATAEGVVDDNAADAEIAADEGDTEVAADALADAPADEADTEDTAAEEDTELSATASRIAQVSQGNAQAAAGDETDADATAARSTLFSVEPAERGDFEDGGYGEGSAKPDASGRGPAGWDIKGNAQSMLFHGPNSPWYKRTKAEVWFRDAASAAAAGFTDATDRGKDKS